MKITSIIVLFLAMAYLAYEAARLSYLTRISGRLVADTRPYERAEGAKSLLILGDSTAVGVGTRGSQYSVAGRIAVAIDASAENHSQSGAVAADLDQQLSLAKSASYDLILIQVGANDVIRWRSIPDAEKSLDSALVKAHGLSSRIVVFTAGKIGEAPFFPRVVAPFLTHRAATLREAFMLVCERHGAVYVDLYSMPDPFSSDPERYYAPDGLHLSDDGYGFWFEQVKQAIDRTWKELI